MDEFEKTRLLLFSSSLNVYTVYINVDCDEPHRYESVKVKRHISSSPDVRVRYMLAKYQSPTCIPNTPRDRTQKQSAHSRGNSHALYTSKLVIDLVYYILWRYNKQSIHTTHLTIHRSFYFHKVALLVCALIFPILISPLDNMIESKPSILNHDVREKYTSCVRLLFIFRWQTIRSYKRLRYYFVVAALYVSPGWTRRREMENVPKEKCSHVYARTRLCKSRHDNARV